MRRRGSRPRLALLTLAPLLLVPSGGGGEAPPLPVLHGNHRLPLHELHETYADLAVEGGVVAGRIRFFKNDLERALGPLVDADVVTLRPGAEADALVLRYLREHLRLEADGGPLELLLLQGSDDAIEHHAGWSVIVQLTAATPIAELRVRNTLLFELHHDQRNILKLVRLPEGLPRTFYFAAGEDEQLLRF